MNILVCFKAVPDLEMLSEADWVADNCLKVDTSFVRNILNCFDESGLEIALKLSDLSEGFNVLYNLTALTIADKKADMYLKTLYALRFTKAVRIDSQDEDIRFVPEKVATIICNYAEKIAKQDVIILGRQSGEGDNAKTPMLVAEMLGCPCVTQVIKIKPVDEKSLEVTYMSDEGIAWQIMNTPCVLSIGNAPNSYMRVPTLKDKMTYGKKPINVIPIQQLSSKEDHFTICEPKLVKLEKMNHTREGIVIEGESPVEKAHTLYDLYLKERLEK